MIRAAITFLAGAVTGYAFAVFYELVLELREPERLPNVEWEGW